MLYRRILATTFQWRTTSRNFVNETASLVRLVEDVKNPPKATNPTRIKQWQPFEPDRALTLNALTYEARRLDKTQVIQKLPQDVFSKLNLDPREFSTNSSVLSSFVSEMGRIKPRSLTRLSAKSQRLLAKTIRRAKMMGVVPVLSRSREPDDFL